MREVGWCEIQKEKVKQVKKKRRKNYEKENVRKRWYKPKMWENEIN